MKIKIISLIIVGILSLPLYAGENSIALKKGADPYSGSSSGSRTIVDDIVTASYDDEADCLYFTFSNATPSRTLVYSTNDSQTALIQQSSLSGLSTTVDISSLPIGNYLVEIYAFDCWWIGYFEID